MSDPTGTRDMYRLRWAMIVLPLVFVWVFEGVRFVVIDRQLEGDEAHLASAVIMAAAVFLFAMLISLYLDRAQKQLVAHNRDLTATHEVSSAVRGGLALPDLLEQSLDRIVTQTGALAGSVTVAQGDGTPLRILRPIAFAPGMAWLGAILEEPADPTLEVPRYARRAAVDTGVLDLPLIRGADRVGAIRLAFHPPVPPAISDSALIGIAGEVAGAAQLGITMANLHRREREREALYEVALQLTGRADLRDVLDAITRHARDLLGAERAVVCLSDARDASLRTGVGATLPHPVLAGSGPGTLERLAMADDGSVCLVAHERAAGGHVNNPHCPLVTLEPGDPGWTARPLRGPDGPMGELCVMRPGVPFSRADRELLGALADMAAIAVRTSRLHEAEEQWTIHAERDRIARELHDSLAQVLGVIHLQLRALENRAKDEASHAMAAELSSIAETADEAYRDVREAILGLRETVREDDGLEGSLREYLRKYSRQTGIATHLECEGDTRRALSPRAEVQLLRVVQEALTNTRKHSAARRAGVRIHAEATATTVTIEDDGLGFDPATVPASMEGGFGMASMRERVEQIGGTLAVQTAPNQGTRIIVRLEPEDTRGTPSAEAQGAAGR